MKCDLCNKPAVVHEVTVRSGIKKEVHLCETHAQEAGIMPPGQQPINQLLTQFVISQNLKGPPTPGSPATPGTPASAKPTNKTCGGCGMSFAQFRQHGRVGCADCYRTFEDELGPLIERAQNGGTHHQGKAPRRAGSTIDRQLLIQKLLKELDHAVAAEQYERAAKLRDRLTSMDIHTRGTGGGIAAGPAARPGDDQPRTA